MSEHRLASVELDAVTLPAATAEIEHERRVAIFDLVEKNHFEPAGGGGGPYALKLALVDGRLAFEIAGQIPSGPRPVADAAEQGGEGLYRHLRQLL